MKAKKGISLIVLVITIIVIIILAGAVILSLQKNNPINQATKAKYVSDKDSVQSEVTLALSSIMANNQKSATITGTSATLPVAGDSVTGDTYYVLTSPMDVVLTDGTTKTGALVIDNLPADGTWYVNQNGKVFLYVKPDTNNNSTITEVTNWTVAQ